MKRFSEHINEGFQHNINNVSSEAGYLYHATNTDNAYDIAHSGLKPFPPGYGTDQACWPDGRREKRIYFTPRANAAWQFAPENGHPVILRTKRTSEFRNETGTGDVYALKPIPASRLEVLTDTGWAPLAPLAESYTLNETMTQPAPWTWTRRGSHEMQAHFKIGEVIYSADFEAGRAGMWEVVFGIDTDYFLKSKGKFKFQYGIINAGNAFQVFATMASILKAFIASVGPKLLYFTAHEESRKKLYNRFMPALARLFPQYDATAVNGSYYLRAKNENVPPVSSSKRV
jgi:hypothetical protein